MMTNKKIFTRKIGRFFSFFSFGEEKSILERFMRILLDLRFFLNFGLEIWDYIHWKKEKILHNFSLTSFY